jgi:hypothetical protein
MFHSQTKKIIIGLLLIIILITLIVVSSSRKKPLGIVQVYPNPESKNVDVKTDINVIFDQEPSLKDISFKINPEFEFKQELFDRSLVITPKENLQGNTTYHIDVLIEKENIFSWTFSTRKLSESEVIEIEVEETQRMYPLANYLPLKTDSYRLTYIKPMVLQVTLKTGSEMEVEEEIKEWIKSKGIDPSTHQIVFK